MAPRAQSSKLATRVRFPRSLCTFFLVDRLLSVDVSIVCRRSYYASARIRSTVGPEKDAAGAFSGPSTEMSWGPPSTGSVCQRAL